MATPIVPLIMPRTGPKLLFTPYNYMAMMEPLRQAGYDPVIIDARLENPRVRLAELAKQGPLGGIGLTSMMGPQLSYGLEVSTYAKKLFPKVPVVWGGILPTELPELTLMHPDIDAVVLTWGEDTFPKLLDRLNAGKLPSDLVGVGYLEDGKPVIIPPVHHKDNHPPLLYDWDSVDLTPYIMEHYGIGNRTITMITTRGCPHSCTFCYGPQFHGSTWSAQPAEQVLADIDYLATKYEFDGIFFNDDNFAVDKKRVMKIAAGLKERNLKYGLSLVVSYFDEELVKHLAETGCTRLYWGPESGSQRMLDIIGKGTKVHQTTDLARWCSKYGLGALMGFMVGHPEERPEDLEATLNQIDELIAIDPTLDISDVKIWTPYPGTQFMADAIAAGFEPPTKIEDWSSFYWNLANTPWMDDRQRDKLQIISYTSLTAFASWRTKGLNPLQNRAVDVFNKVERFRWKKRAFRFAPELKALQWWVNAHQAEDTSRLDMVRRVKETVEAKIADRLRL